MKQEAKNKVLYFAYGSNMDSGQMGERCPDSSVCGLGELKEYRFIINQRGYATVIPDHTHSVYGVVWQLDPWDEIALDHCEGLRSGLYDKCYREIVFEGQTVMAMIYIDHGNVQIGLPRAGYLEGIIKGAQSHGLPEEYIQMLRSWPREAEYHSFNRCINRVKSGEVVVSVDSEDSPALVKWAKTHRDEILLAALDTGVFDPGNDDRELMDHILRSLEPYAEDLRMRRMGRLAEQCEIMKRFKAHLWNVHYEATELKAWRDACIQGEIRTEGIIITSDPQAPHDATDRLIVTRHAPVLAWLWERIFEGDHGVHPRTLPFIEIFADFASQGDDDRVDEEFLFVVLFGSIDMRLCWAGIK